MRELSKTERGLRRSRAVEFDEYVMKAFEQGLPVRIIVLDGRTDKNPTARVQRRALDAVP
jgi:hypothetical protein